VGQHRAGSEVIDLRHLDNDYVSHARALIKPVDDLIIDA
jgi:hypothetical protein